MRRSTCALLLLALIASAHAEDQRLAGSKLVMQQRKRAAHLVLVARDGIVAPLPGGAEDPTLVGAVVSIGNPRTGEHARFEAPPRDWRVNDVGTVFRFRNHLQEGAGSELRALIIKHQRRLKISARALGITLDEEAQQSLYLVLATGTRRYCLLFGGTVDKDKPGRFMARKAPAPTACPAPIVGATTTTTSRPPGTGPTSTSVTSSTRVTNSTSATSSTSSTTSPSVGTIPPGSTTSTTTGATIPGGSTTSTTDGPPPPPTTTSTQQPGGSTATVQPTTSTSTSSSTTPTVGPTTSSTQGPSPTTSTTLGAPPTTSTSVAPPTTTSSTRPPAPTTSSTAPPPPTTSTTRAPTTTTTTTTLQPCGPRGILCGGACPAGTTCQGLLGLCGCR